MSADSMKGDLRQARFPKEFRISVPELIELSNGSAEQDAQEPATESGSDSQSTAALQDALCALATCLWYTKTKHLKVSWEDMDASLDDSRSRRTLGRINRSIDAITETGIEVVDPTGQRYPTGGEALMKPVQFSPSNDVETDTVVGTVKPIIYLNEKVIQRAEVFVEVPDDADQTAPPHGNGGATT